MQRFVVLPDAGRVQAFPEAKVQATDNHVVRPVAQRQGFLLFRLFLPNRLLGGLESACVEPSDIREAASVQVDVCATQIETIAVVSSGYTYILNHRKPAFRR